MLLDLTVPGRQQMNASAVIREIDSTLLTVGLQRGICRIASEHFGQTYVSSR
jgi:hypothetical protein